MGGSLRDQLLKAGLVSAQQAKQAEAERRKQGRQQRGGSSGRDRAAAQHAQQALAEKTRRDREINRQREEEARRRALAAEIEDLIRAHRVPTDRGERPYHFTDGRVIKRIEVTDAQRRQLAGGQLAVVRQGAGYALVPAEVAERIRSRDAASVVLLNQPDTGTDPDDPYAQYTVPDDLMW